MCFGCLCGVLWLGWAAFVLVGRWRWVVVGFLEGVNVVQADVGSDSRCATSFETSLRPESSSPYSKPSSLRST